MRLVRLVYASTVIPTVEPKDVESILDVAREKNRELGLTGFLCFDGKVFVQWIEGPRSAVNLLYQSIMVDWRHENLTLLDYCEVDERTFPDWDMGFVSTELMDEDLVLKYSGSRSFEPFAMSARSVRSFLVDFARRRGPNRE